MDTEQKAVGIAVLLIHQSESYTWHCIAIKPSESCRVCVLLELSTLWYPNVRLGHDVESLKACERVQVSQWNVADDVVEDYNAGLEYGEAESILKSVQKGDAREYLVR